jgi:putative oxidoreductase
MDGQLRYTKKLKKMNEPTIVSKWKTYAPQLRSILRIVAAIVFIQIGTMKLFGYPMSMPGGKTAEFFSEIWIAGFLETFGGVLILIGLFTRPVAFILAGEMAVAYFQAHAPKSIWTVVNGGASAVLFCFIFLYFSAAGAGPWSVDAKRKAR